MQKLINKYLSSNYCIGEDFLYYGTDNTETGAKVYSKKLIIEVGKVFSINNKEDIKLYISKWIKSRTNRFNLEKYLLAEPPVTELLQELITTNHGINTIVSNYVASTDPISDSSEIIINRVHSLETRMDSLESIIENLNNLDTSGNTLQYYC